MHEDRQMLVEQVEQAWLQDLELHTGHERQRC
jgi:hypothetical protein